MGPVPLVESAFEQLNTESKHEIRTAKKKGHTVEFRKGSLTPLVVTPGPNTRHNIALRPGPSPMQTRDHQIRSGSLDHSADNLSTQE